MHREQQLFLSVYVDNLKLAGKKENIGPMWEKMGGFLELEPAKKMGVSQYLGCDQREIVPEIEDIERMIAAFENFSVKRGDASAGVAHPALRKSQGETLTTIDKVSDEAHSEIVELHENTKREGKTSRGTHKSYQGRS